MASFKDFDNPFTVQSPEDMSAEDAKSLFVDVFTDFPKIPCEGHVFLHGPRGSGKSMMFRYLQPDCQKLVKNCRLPELPFFSIWISLKNTDLKLTELLRLENQHANIILNEHFMTMPFAGKAFELLLKSNIADNDDSYLGEIKQFMQNTFAGLLIDCGWEGELGSLDKIASPQECFMKMKHICEDLFKQVISYLKKLAFMTEPLPFNGPLCGYLDFLFLLCELKQLSFMPKGPIFLLIDDADNLNIAQTRILNSWVSTRTSAKVSIKISTQLRYKTYRTATGSTIDTPHDYSEINISTIYTGTRKNKYMDRVRAIVAKRLALFNLLITPEEFFPEDKDQEDKIRTIVEEYRAKWATEGRGYRASDDATRYARPDFMKSLAGTSKSSHSYSYAGFVQLVHVSSGIIRYFLESAAVMFSETKGASREHKVSFILPATQDKVVRQIADDFLFSEFEKAHKDITDEAPAEEQLNKLYNLVRILGGTFRQILLSDRSERRVFSIAFSDEPSPDIKNTMMLGVQYGYFHLSAVGNKDGTGRTPLYILSRRLSPHFNLDPTSFAGYLFVTSDKIAESLISPDKLLRRIKNEGTEKFFEERQLKLFE